MKWGEIVGAGNTAEIYGWSKEKVIKLFFPGYPKEAVEKEFHNAKAICDLDFAKPKAYELMIYKGRIGIVYDRVYGECLRDWVIRTGDVQGCASHMERLHKKIVQNNIDSVPNYKDFLKHNVENALLISSEKQKETLHMIERLPDGDTLCHGDFHPGNVFISDGQTSVIDFMNVCHGNYLYDIARTVFLIEYTPIPVASENREMLLQIKKALADLYLVKMKITREMIEDYLSVIFVARMGECPGEYLGQ